MTGRHQHSSWTGVILELVPVEVSHLSSLSYELVDPLVHQIDVFFNLLVFLLLFKVWKGGKRVGVDSG